MDNLNGIAMFVRAAQTQSFVVTARAMGISPSAVSKGIGRLEERVGVRLFQRSTRSIRLTAEGQAFMERCQRVLQELSAAESELASMNGAPQGRLRIGLAYAAGLPLPLVSAFAERYPAIELELVFSDGLSDVIEEGLDAVIRGGEAKDSRLKSRRLGTARLVLVASPGYLERCGTPSRPSDLATHACLHYRESTSGKVPDWPMKRAASGVATPLPRTVVSNSLDALLYLARDGRGITCAPDFAVRGMIAEGALTTVLDAYMARTLTFRVLWPNSRQMTPKLRAFVDFAVDHLGSMLG